VTGNGDSLASEWRRRFKDADSLSPAASAADKRKRGRDFELILRDMLTEAGLEPRIRFRPDGEEVDGSFFHRGRVLLLEAKWTKDPQPASSIYQFRGKVEGKLIGTIGVFISMGGYSDDAVDALIAGKVLNVILFSDDDMRAIAGGQLGFCDALDRKLREAAEFGTPFLPLRDPVNEAPLYRGPAPGEPRKARAVIVEGLFDAVLVHTLADVLGPSAFDLEVVPVGGASNLGALAGTASSIGFTDGVVVIADGDGRPDVKRRRIESDLASRGPDLVGQTSIVVLDPTFEEALGVDRPPADRRRPGPGQRLPEVTLHAGGVRQAAAANPIVRQLLDSLGLR
jgi:Restriction endonuclease